MLQRVAGVAKCCSGKISGALRDTLPLSCSVLQCVAVFCSVLQCIAVYCSGEISGALHIYPASELQCVAVRCSVLQCSAVCCSVLQCVPVERYPVPCVIPSCRVAVCCSFLQSRMYDSCLV